MADDCAQLWILYSCCALGRYHSDDWHVDDTKDMRLCMDSLDWIPSYEKGKKKMKKMLNTAMVYFVFAIAAGVFYREFTKLNGFFGRTALGFLHTHLFVLGMFLFLILSLFCSQGSGLAESKKFKRFYVLYNISLPFMVCMMMVRGIAQVLELELTKSVNAMISGMAGISHILITIALFLLFSALKKSAADRK